MITRPTLARTLHLAISLAIALVQTAAVQTAWAQWTTAPVTAPRLQYRTFQSSAAGTVVSYHVFTPPAYDDQPARRFPVLYWLHGSGSATAGIAPMTNWFSAAMAQGLMPPMIIVFPNGMPFGMYCDAADGSRPVETVLISELIPHIDASFRTTAARNGRVLEGFSMGGYGATRSYAKHSRLFGGVSILAAGPMQLDFPNAPPDAPIPAAQRFAIFADVWDSDPALVEAANPSTLAAANAPVLIAGRPLIRVAVGGDDSVLSPNLDFHNRLTSLGITHSFNVYPGVGHSTIPLLTSIGPSKWAFYRDALVVRCDGVDIAGAGGGVGPDGELTADDIIVYIARFTNGNPLADIAGAGGSTTPDGELTADDIILFIARFTTGC